MAATLAETILPIHNNPPRKPPTTRKIFLSYSAYAKNVIQNLKSSNIIVEKGLSEFEFTTIESKFNFTFPPDLRSILQEGLPIGPGFPNWRSSSETQLEILKNLPILGFCKKVKKCNFWMNSWGIRPNDDDLAVDIANVELQKYPVLVPIYQKFYIPVRPCLAGNPVFYVHDGEVKLWSFDISGFFDQVEFEKKEMILRRPSLLNLLHAPAWAATEARKIEFWTEMAEMMAARVMNGDGARNVSGMETAEMVEARGKDGGGAWEGIGWREEDMGVAHGGGRHRRWWSEDLEGYLEDVFLRLTEAGWKEEDVRDMMMVDGGGHGGGDSGSGCRRRSSDGDAFDKKRVESHVRLLSKRLLRAGWSTEDVVDSLGSPEENKIYTEEDSCIDFYQIKEANELSIS